MESIIKYFNGLEYILEIFNDIKNVFLYDNNIDQKYNIYDIELLLKITISISGIYASHELNIPRIIEKFNNYNCINTNDNTYINIKNVNRDLGYIFKQRENYELSIKDRITYIIEKLSYIK